MCLPTGEWINCKIFAQWNTVHQSIDTSNKWMDLKKKLWQTKKPVYILYDSTYVKVHYNRQGSIYSGKDLNSGCS